MSAVAAMMTDAVAGPLVAAGALGVGLVLWLLYVGVRRAFAVVIATLGTAPGQRLLPAASLGRAPDLRGADDRGRARPAVHGGADGERHLLAPGAAGGGSDRRRRHGTVAAAAGDRRRPRPGPRRRRAAGVRGVLRRGHARPPGGGGAAGGQPQPLRGRRPRHRAPHGLGDGRLADLRRRLVAGPRQPDDRRRGPRRAHQPGADVAAPRHDGVGLCAGRVSHRGADARAAPRLARGRLLRLRHDLRRVGARLHRAALRLVGGARPVRAGPARCARSGADVRPAALPVLPDDQHPRALRPDRAVPARLAAAGVAAPLRRARTSARRWPASPTTSTSRPATSTPWPTRWPPWAATCGSIRPATWSWWWSAITSRPPWWRARARRGTCRCTSSPAATRCWTRCWPEASAGAPRPAAVPFGPMHALLPTLLESFGSPPARVAAR